MLPRKKVSKLPCGHVSKIGRKMIKNKNKKYYKLRVWQKAHQFALNVYEITKNFPSEERFALISQLHRAVLSIPTNIVEGQASCSRKDFLHFLNIANRSLAETEYLLEFSHDLGYLKEADLIRLDRQREEVGFLLNALIKSLRK